MTSNENATPEARVKSKEDLKIKLRSILTGRSESEIRQAIGNARHRAKDKQNSSSNSKAEIPSSKKIQEILQEDGNGWFFNDESQESQD